MRLTPLLLATVVTSGCADSANLSDLKPSIMYDSLSSRFCPAKLIPILKITTLTSLFYMFLAVLAAVFSAFTVFIWRGVVHLSNFVADSELIPSAKGRLKIYSASIATNEEGPRLKVGSFAYVDGNFRYLCTLTITPDWHQFYFYYDRPFEP